MKPGASTGDTRAFRYREGVRIEGTTLACDPLRSANEVVFISHAPPPGDRRLNQLFARKLSAQQVMMTEATQTLLGEAGEKLGLKSLVCAYGRPFSLGDVRIELAPTGFGPGAAALSCRQGDRQLLYSGPIRMGQPSPWSRDCEVRPASAVCIDATFAAPMFSFPPLAEAFEKVSGWAQETLARKLSAVVLVDDDSVALELAANLLQKGLPLRAHRHLSALNSTFAKSGLTLPSIKAHAPRTTDPKILLWPVRMHQNLADRVSESFSVSMASGHAADPEIRGKIPCDMYVPLSGRSDHANTLAYVEASGAQEVAAVNGHAESAAQAFKSKGLNAYRLGAPVQIGLF